MGIVFALLKRKRAKITLGGKTVDILTLTTSVSMSLAERIVKEKGVSIEKAEKIVIECIGDGMKKLRKEQ